MTNVNRHGLARYIPADIALEVRRRSKFGCVYCRSAIYQYEHIDPEFNEALSHNPDNICLLCGGCHDRVTRGRLSKQTIRAVYEEICRSDTTKRPFEEFDINSSELSVSFGSCIFRQTQSLITINGESILSIQPPQNGQSAPSISGVFYDSAGVECFRITENVWQGPLDCYDITVVGPRVTIRTEADHVALAIEVIPPDGIRINQLNMYKDGCHITMRGDELLIGQIRDAGDNYIGLRRFQCVGAMDAIDVDNRKVTSLVPTGLQMIGGEGIILNGTGIIVGKRASQMMIGQMQLWHLTQ